jgi:hypothetical protein
LAGLSNKAQAIVMAVSGIFMALGTASASIPKFIPEQYRAPLAIFFWICGIVGFALKEALGGQAPAPTPSASKT